MAKVQIITAVTLDGFLPKAEEKLMQWVKNTPKGFPYWHERSSFLIPPDYPFLDLVCDKDRTGTSCIYLAEISAPLHVELLKNLSRYHVVDELIVYLLPITAGTGISVLNSLTPDYWHLHKSVVYTNGICRVVYHRILK